MCDVLISNLIVRASLKTRIKKVQEGTEVRLCASNMNKLRSCFETIAMLLH